MKYNLYILGAGDLGREIYAAFQQTGNNGYKNILFADDDREKIGGVLDGLTVVSFETALNDIRAKYISAIAPSPELKETFLGRFSERFDDFVSVIHPDATVYPSVAIGKGCFVAANSTLNHGSIILDHVLINCNVSIGHDATIGIGSSVNPGCIISGRCNLDSFVFLGMSVNIFPGKTVGAYSEISANTVISRNVKPKVKVFPIVKNYELPKKG
ncbi:acetyltransferase [bacterium]|jgi:sugar O-acyltransferase (sialic acid O-acetyltransferase NeuD family)|nr:acetyltransferase [bacterium]